MSHKEFPGHRSSEGEFINVHSAFDGDFPIESLAYNNKLFHLTCGPGILCGLSLSREPQISLYHSAIANLSLV